MFHPATAVGLEVEAAMSAMTRRMKRDQKTSQNSPETAENDPNHALHPPIPEMANRLRGVLAVFHTVL